MANKGSTLLALITGTAIGAGLGVLYAPNRGDKTRKNIQKQVNKAKSDLDAKVKETYAELNERAAGFKGDLENRIDTAISGASYKADEVILTLEDKLKQLKAKNAEYKGASKTGSSSSSSSVSGSNKRTDASSTPQPAKPAKGARQDKKINV